MWIDCSRLPFIKYNARVFLCGCALIGVAHTFAEEGFEPEVVKLIGELDADRQQARQFAEDQLIELGIIVLDYLPAADAKMSREMRERLQRVRSALEKLAANQVINASLVTLEGKFLLSDAIQQIQEQTGNRVVDFRERFEQPANDLEVSLSLNESPFWDAIQHLVEQADLGLYPHSGEVKTLALVAMDPDSHGGITLWSTDKAFRFTAINAVARRDLRDFDATSLRLGVEVMWEPRLVPIVIRLPLEKIVAVADNGEQIKVLAGGETLEYPLQSAAAAVELSIPLNLPTREVRRIKQFTAELSAVVPGQKTAFEFSDLDEVKNLRQTRGEVTVTLVDSRQKGSVREVRIAVQYDQAFDALDSHRSWIFENESYLLGGTSERRDHGGYELFCQKANEVGLSYKFTELEGLTDYKFVYVAPTTLSVQHLKIELENLPLP